ncbi:twin-arginine translocation signal domain-containing protein [Halobaculum gomorrense]|uniref:Tat (Twin-arginine translocation) pathway signal sequence n=1 Tax=Halobaculum gomorrense TaxID=43928 RepID=A0A1M5LTF5_9EURY|nr:twin-arginine translocation signal domain-containing protein [Halobaculum gomorrense]SHG67653.1 Tat (twin-arginine translocation) pathway signal sequence [Halobaculum gomorrense]
MDRRRFLAGAAAAGVAGLAGCGTASGTVRPPSLPEDRLDEGGWERTRTDTREVLSRTVAGVDVTATAVTRVYDDAALRAAVSEKTLGALDAPLSNVFASRIAFSPNLAEIPLESAREELAARAGAVARDQFESQLSSAGLTDISASDAGTLTVETGEDASLTEYSAAFSFDALSFDVRGETVTVEGGSAAVEGLLASWIHDGGLLIAGGAYPAESFARTVEQDLSGAITVTVDVDLGLTPDAYRDEVRGIVTHVE